MNAVIQQDRTGCGIAAVAALSGRPYAAVKEAAAVLGISVDDPALWSDPQYIRKLLAHFDIEAGSAEERFRAWEQLPACALLAIKWHREKTGPAWHWVVFVREADGSVVLDSKRGLQTNRRTDFGRIKPRWFIRLSPKPAVTERHPRSMPQDILIRDETPADDAAITVVTVAAFETLEISDHTEQFIVAALRRAGALTVSLVAVWNGRVIGHIAFSPVAISDGTVGWFALGPISVLPEFQRQGVGTALIQAGISRLKALKARGCCLVGHPGYYQRFGFQRPADLHVNGVPPDVFFALAFDGHVPRGTVTFDEAFKAEA